MSRMVNRPIAVGPPGGAGRSAGGEVPRWFTWKGRRLGVEAVIDEWLDTGRWWQEETEKRFVRVVAGQGAARGTYELFCDLGTGQWYLYRILD